MASLSDIVSIVITRTSAAVSRATYSIPMVAAYHTVGADLVRTYSANTALASMATDGFAATSPAYLAVQAMLSQSPRPKTVKVGKLTSTWTHQVTLTPTLGSTGTVFSGRVNEQPWTYTQLGGDNLAAICTAIAAAIAALSGVTATGVSGTTVVITADAAATLFNVIGPSGTGVYTFADTTAAGTIATEVAALRAADSAWYGLVIDRTSEAAINAVAAWAETDRVLFLATSADSGIGVQATTTDIASDVTAAAYKRTSVWFHEEYDSFLGAAMLGLILPYDPGSATWAHKAPAGVAVSTFSASQQASALGKRANILVSVAGLGDTQFGTSGSDFLDNVQAEDWLASTIQEDVYAFLHGSPKIPYEDRSVARLKGVIGAVLQRGIDRGVVASDPAPFVDAPLVADVSSVDRAARLLPDVFFSCRLTGAIHTTEITGLVSL